MGWLLLALRRTELQRSINDHTYEKLQLTRQLRKLSNFSTSIADGNVTPSEIASLGTDLFGDALDFMGYSNEAAQEVAQEQTDAYESAYGQITQEQYYNSGVSSQAQLYFDESGNLDTETLYKKFYEEALKEYAQEYIAPLLKEKESEIEDKQTELETLVESEESELQTLKQSISGQIQNSTIQLS